MLSETYCLGVNTWLLLVSVDQETLPCVWHKAVEKDGINNAIIDRVALNRLLVVSAGFANARILKHGNNVSPVNFHMHF